MEKIIEAIKRFIEKVKDDPALSDTFRFAAAELHKELNPEPVTPSVPAEPAPVEPPAPEAAPVPEPQPGG
jgi:hypothetical protein